MTSALLELSTKPRIGFAGLGWIGRHRMNAVAESGHGEIAAVCDPIADLSDEVAPATRSYEELLESDVDAVVIATPSALHAEQAVAALERGKAVFCQKPLGRDAAETKRVVDAARASDRLLGVDLSYRFTAAMRAVRDLVSSGAIGDVYAADLVFHNAYGPDKPWFYDPKLSGGGCVIDLGIHLADMALWTLGFPKVEGVGSRLFAKGWADFDPSKVVEDYATAELDLDGGRSVRLACSWNLSAGRDCVLAATFYGTRGAAAFHNVDGSFYDFVAEHYEKTKRTRLTEGPDAWGGRAIVAWAAQLAESRSFDREVEHVVEVARVLDAIYRRPEEASK